MKKDVAEAVSRRKFLSRGSQLILLAQGGWWACTPAKEPTGEPSPEPGSPDAAPEQMADLGPELAPDQVAPVSYPKAVIPPGMTKEALQQKIKSEPFATLYKKLEADSKREIRQPEPGTWTSQVNEHNATNAAAAAFLAWLNDDKEAAERAKANIATFKDNYSDHTTWDLNIRMPAPLIHYTEAYDLLRGTAFFSEEEATKLKTTLLSISKQFFAEFILDPQRRGLVLTPAQNNHPIRTACAIGYVGMYFQEEKETEPWLDWALSELDYLWGAQGKYVMKDGGVTEGPFYYRFALAPSALFLQVAEHMLDPKKTYKRSCVNRNDVDPWTGHGCQEGESFTFANPLKSEYFRNTIEWTLAIRQPDGYRVPVADAHLSVPNGAPLLIPHGAPAYHYWDWESNPSMPLVSEGGMSLAKQYIIYVSKPEKVAPPTWTNRFFPQTGHATFRSGWTPDDRFFMLVAESGPSRKTLHDHVDGTTFTLGAYGEQLFIDTGYYKTADLKPPETADPRSHNVILINGAGAPKKGLINNWGDADAFLENTKDGDKLAWAEARQTYQKTEIVRGTAFVRKRYVIIADRLTTTATEAREHTFRLHHNGGYELKEGKVELLQDGPHLERPKGGAYAYIQSTAGQVTHKEPPFNKGKIPHVQGLTNKNGDSHFVSDSVISAIAPNFLTVLAPYKVGADKSSADGPLEVTKVDCGTDAAGWLIKSTEGTDFAWLRGPKAAAEVTLPGGEKVETDAAFALVSLDGKLAAISRGKTLSLQGKEVLNKDASQGVELLES